jgi:acyl-ACP thioesterase
MYKMEGRVRYSECAADNRLKVSAIINYFQDCTTENSEILGVGHMFLKERKRAWILNAWQVQVYRRPSVGEQVETFTWATGFNGIFGPRDFVMKTPEGETLVAAHSLWVYVDTETGRPVKPEEVDLAPYEVEEALPGEVVSRKIKFPKEAGVIDTFQVHKYHIDTNDHMNNSRYVELACEALPETFGVTGLRVEYKKAAVYGDELVLRSIAEEGCILTALCNQEGSPYAIVEFTGEEEK